MRALDLESMTDELLAMQLLMGRAGKGKNGVPEITFLSRHTQPTEDEAREALGRALRRLAWRQVNPNSGMLLLTLAGVFDPVPIAGVGSPLRAAFKKRSRGHANPYGDAWIAGEVEMLRLRYGKSYERAIAEIADRIERSPRRVKKIYGKNRWGRKSK